MMRKGKVLFIIHDLYQNDVEFPLGVAYLASALRSIGTEVVICNQDIYHYSNEQVVELFLENKEYVLIGVGFLAARFKETILDLCDVINIHKGKAKLILGGHGPSAIPKYMLKTTGADLIAVGESEETIIDVLNAILLNKSFERIPGIAYREGDSFYVNDRRPIRKDLDSFLFPAWDLFPMEIYMTNRLEVGQKSDRKSVGIISSRGCTNRCTFCYRLEKGIRFRNIQNVVREMKYLYERYGITYFCFLDELFAISYERLIGFVANLKQEKLLGKIEYNVGGIRAESVTEDMGKLFQDSGCHYINIGFESASQKCLDELKKNITVEDNIKSAKILKSCGIHIGANFIWGAPSDTEETLKLAAEFLKQYDTHGELRTIRPITPYPGSEMYSQAIAKGLLTGPQDFFDKFKNSDVLTVNFTKVPDERVYEILFEVNKDLILNHYKYIAGNMKEANQIINDFYSLYFEGQVKFRGARRFERN